jgi:hypothetical protein
MALDDADLSSPAGRARAAASLMDEAVEIPGIGYGVGLDPVLTLLPISGDVVAGLISLYVVFEGWRAGVGPLGVALMLLIAAVDAALGLIPFVGPVIDAVWKANKWNVWIIDRAT